eukprot:CAMPEP_0181295036 /NCGR_PEP_ID=MMETSP1101-20121128/3924_1 /TAXON_ID=46948 /ORGANISM="Rhodomonas abbreviata, Strain Caron Lab Isolate" /LENGTH=68 /DNA_ID=CAMNT_0023399743 /DNA_START=39 /DNA_END=245 /DNA_ORIENTATION=-
MLFVIPSGSQLYPERPIGYTVPRTSYFLPGWQPYYPIFAKPIHQPTSEGYWNMEDQHYADGELEPYFM